MLKISYCEECQEKLREYGNMVLISFECICEAYFSGNVLEISISPEDEIYPYLPVIAFLEMKGVIVTADSGLNTIRIKPASFNILGDMHDQAYHVCMHKEKVQE